MIKPLSPQEALQRRVVEFPPEVIYAINELVKAKWDGKHSFIIKQNEAIDAILLEFRTADKLVERNDVFNNDWLDFEAAFEREGWKVEYDKPSYGDNYEAYFKFSVKGSCNG